MKKLNKDDFIFLKSGGVKGYKVEEKETLELARQIWKDETKDIEGLIRVGKK